MLCRKILDVHVRIINSSLCGQSAECRDVAADLFLFLTLSCEELTTKVATYGTLAGNEGQKLWL